MLGASVSPQYSSLEGSYYLYNFGTSGLASTAGKLELYQGEYKIDEICWGKLECDANYVKFATKQEDNYSLMRCEQDCETNYISQKYYPNILLDAIIEKLPDLPFEPDPEPSQPQNSCDGLIFTEIYSYYQDDASEQFIELYNPTATTITLDSCRLKYKTSSFTLQGGIAPGVYYVFKDEKMTLTKDPSTANILSLENPDGTTATIIEHPHGQKKGTSHALFDFATSQAFWRQTYRPTPGEINIYQEFQTCEDGKVINPATGNCIKQELQEAKVVTCPEGKYLNPLTNRCKNLESTESNLTPCKEGYERNPETNRCRKVEASATEMSACGEGYERNPETGRCRKIRTNDGAETDYAPTPTNDDNYANPKIFIATAAIAAAILAGIIYAICQYRQEICKFGKRIRAKIHKV